MTPEERELPELPEWPPKWAADGIREAYRLGYLRGLEECQGIVLGFGTDPSDDCPGVVNAIWDAIEAKKKGGGG